MSSRYDENGNPIPDTSPTTSSASKMRFDEHGQSLDPSLQLSVMKDGAGQPPVDLRNSPFVGRAAVEALPFAGSFAGPEGTVVGSMVKNLIKSYKPDLFGQPPQDMGDIALGAGKDILTNNLVPGGVGVLSNAISGLLRRGVPGVADILASKGVSSFPAVKEGLQGALADKVVNKFQYPETGVLESAAENAKGTKESILDNIEKERANLPKGSLNSPGLESAIADHENVFGKNAVGNQLVNLQKEFESGATQVAGSQTYKQIANTALSDVRHVRNFKLATGESKTVEQLALNNLVTKNFSDTTGKINSTAILKELSGPKNEIYSEAVSPQTMDIFKGLMQEIEKQKVGTIPNAIVKYSNGHLLWEIPAITHGIATGNPFSGLAGGVGTSAAAISITNQQLGKLMAKPGVAEAVLKAMKTAPSAKDAGLLNKILESNLPSIGTKVTLDSETVPQS